MSRQKQITGLYTAAHLFVDLATVNLVLAGVMAGGGSRLAAIVIYNFIAFACQLPLGIVADRLEHDRWLAAVGCAAAALAYVLRPYAYAACCLAALGNAIFHLGGGREVLRLSDGRAALPGVFVSSGALGLWLAYRFAGRLGFLALPLVLILLAAAIFFGPCSAVPAGGAASQRPESGVLGIGVAAAAACLLLTVMLRSYLGQIMDFSWKSGILSLLLVLAVVLGKALGGLLADRWGWARLTGLSLSLAAILFIGSFRFPLAGIAAVLLFNMTMPVTLTTLYLLLPNRPGLAFGSTTLALFIGFVAVIADKTSLFSPVGLALGAALSALLMIGGLALFSRGRRDA